MSQNNIVRLVIAGLIFLVGFDSYAASPISDEERVQIKSRGEVSAIAEWCGLDWRKKSFLPFMKMLRQSEKPDNVITFASVYHGIYMERKASDLKEIGVRCVKSDVDGILPHLLD
ncbi:MAG: hypothetical protein COB36_01500 [Alphaproteobacteria bacterium]|nr:MAG: hypothetical protein COB36_01500 [Alphaproteobacteria bacterium]